MGLDDDFRLPPLEEILRRVEDMEEPSGPSKSGFDNYFCSKKDEADGYGNIQVSEKPNASGHYSVICSKYYDRSGQCNIGEGPSSDCPYNQSDKKFELERPIGRFEDTIDWCKEAGKNTIIVALVIGGVIGLKFTMDYLLIDKPANIYRSFLETKDRSEKIELGVRYLEYFKERKYDGHVKKELMKLGMDKRIIETHDKR